MVSAVAADEQTAALVGVEVGAPMICVDDVIVDQDGQPRALSQIRFRGDRIALTAVLSAQSRPIGGQGPVTTPPWVSRESS